MSGEEVGGAVEAQAGRTGQLVAPARSFTIHHARPFSHGNCEKGRNLTIGRVTGQGPRARFHSKVTNSAEGPCERGVAPLGGLGVELRDDGRCS